MGHNQPQRTNAAQSAEHQKQQKRSILKRVGSCEEVDEGMIMAKAVAAGTTDKRKLLLRKVG
jgi:hypothetical protein